MLWALRPVSNLATGAGSIASIGEAVVMKGCFKEQKKLLDLADDSAFGEIERVVKSV